MAPPTWKVSVATKNVTANTEVAHSGGQKAPAMAKGMTAHAGASPALIRPWDKEHEGQIAVVSPSLENLTAVIDAINAAVAQSNTDYEHELALQRDSAKQHQYQESEPPYLTCHGVRVRPKRSKVAERSRSAARTRRQL